MFYLYISRLKCLFRNREAMFWSYLFPLLLATCFFFAFNNLWDSDAFDTISVGYVKGEASTQELETILTKAETKEGTPMFKVTVCDETKAASLLEKGDIEAYIVSDNKPALFIKTNGLNETITKSFLDSYTQMSTTISNILKENPNAMEEGLIADVMDYQSYVETVTDDKKPATLLIYFYSLLAYTCVFASNWGLDEAVNIQADLSVRGARVSISPMHKKKLFLCNMLAAFTAHLGSLSILFLYLYFGIKVDFGANLGYLFLVCLVGSLAGMCLGALVGVWVRKKAEVKEAILTVVTLGGGFLSGMMVPNMKFIVAEHLPFLGYINPVSMITDAMYSLYYYDTYERYYMNLVYLCIITVVFGGIAYLGIRRKNYASV